MSDLTQGRPLERRKFLMMSGACAGAALTTGTIAIAAGQKVTSAIHLVAPQTALVLIDLQNSNAKAPFAPTSFTEVVTNSRLLAAAVRRHGGVVAYTRVIVQQIAKLPTDVQLPAGPIIPSSDELVASSGVQKGDVLVTKRQFGAFYGTDLDEQLRRRGVTSIILGGVATEAGVESTARAALDRGYALVFAKDALSGASERSNAMFVEDVFPVIGRVRTTSEIIEALTA